ncbi:MAG: hypothetical protein U1F77_09215 [Kiritimatiellia bacterium]
MPRILLIAVLVLGSLWAVLHLGREAGVVGGGRRETPRGAPFTMTRTLVCRNCGLSIPATPEELERRYASGQARPGPDGSTQVFLCDRDRTPTLELVYDVKPRP